MNHVHFRKLKLVITLILMPLAGCRCGVKQPGPTESQTIRPGPSPERPLAKTRSAPRSPQPPGRLSLVTPAPRQVQISYTPKVLRVLQRTTVTFKAVVPKEMSLRYRWQIGSQVIGTGSSTSITFDGKKDGRVRLTAWNDEGFKADISQKVPLERLKVVPMAELESTLKILTAIPPRPDPGPGNYRFVVISDSNRGYGRISQGAGVAAAVAQITGSIKPHFVIHNGDMIAGQQPGLGGAKLRLMWQRYNDQVTYPLARASIPLVPVPGNHDADPDYLDRQIYLDTWKQPVQKPKLNYLSDAQYPLYYSFTHKGAYFIVIDSLAKSTREMITWLKRELRRARVYRSRFVFSHLPFEKLLNTSYGTLRNKFELYELFIKYDVTTFFSAHYEVYYKGKYGDLNVVSTGILAGTCRKLIGQEDCQGMSFVVVDVIDYKPARIFAVRGPEFTQVFDEFLLPDRVGSYTRSY